MVEQSLQLHTIVPAVPSLSLTSLQEPSNSNTIAMASDPRSLFYPFTYNLQFGHFFLPCLQLLVIVIILLLELGILLLSQRYLPFILCRDKCHHTLDMGRIPNPLDMGRIPNPLDMGRIPNPLDMGRIPNPLDMGRIPNPLDMGRIPNPLDMGRIPNPLDMGRIPNPLDMGRIPNPLDMKRRHRNIPSKSCLQREGWGL